MTEPPKKKRKRSKKKSVPLYNTDKILYETDPTKCLPKYQSQGMSDGIYSVISGPSTSLSDLYMLIPSCLKEFEDSMKMWSIRNDFVKLCIEKVKLFSPPYEAFNRWLFKIFSIQSPPKKRGRGKKKPMLESNMNGIFPKFYRKDIHHQSGEVLLNEIVSEIPFRVRRGRFVHSRNDLTRNVSLYFKRLDFFFKQIYQPYINNIDSVVKKEEEGEEKGESEDDSEEIEEKETKKKDLKSKYEEIQIRIETIKKEIEEVGVPRTVFEPPPTDGLSQQEQQQPSNKMLIITSTRKLVDIPKTVVDYFDNVITSFDEQVKTFFHDLIYEHSFAQYYSKLFDDLTRFINDDISTNKRRSDSEDNSQVEVLDGRSDRSIKILRYTYRHSGGNSLTSLDYYDEIQILRKHFEKLEFLYTHHVRCDPSKKHFSRCCYSLVKRYNTFIGNNNSIHHRISSVMSNNNNNQKKKKKKKLPLLFSPSSEGTNFHAAAPEHVFKFLNEELDVGCELFASPLNCYFPRFCSVFMDTDVFFGR